MKREDSSNNVYHWIKTDCQSKKVSDLCEAAFEVMRQIIDDGFIRGSSKYIIDSTPCVCFTESPRDLIVSDISRYQPFGFGFSKKRIYELGGRPVIYQSKEELNLLDESIRWRHVQYDPTASDVNNAKGIDFTWEREWRMPTVELHLMESVEIILPTKAYLESLISYIDVRTDNTIYRNEISYGYSVPDDPYILYGERFRDTINSIN
ncbi:hypothetical protein ACU9CO_000611 [Cronobacter dublinensis]